MKNLSAPLCTSTATLPGARKPLASQTKSLSRIAFTCEGDAESSDKAFSGIAKSMVDHLRLLGHDVLTIDTSSPLMLRAITAALTYSPDRATWRSRFRHGSVGFNFRSMRARKSLRPIKSRVDVILQIGPGFVPPGNGKIPYVLYCDWNMALSIQDRENPYSSAHRITLNEAEAINSQHRIIYEKAAYIFTISERLREAFIRDYGIDPKKVVTAYAGPNIDPTHFPIQGKVKLAAKNPTVLFCGKEFARKGGDVLMDAFRRVRSEVPDAQLLITGPRELRINEPGVRMLGFLRKDVPEEMERLLWAYREASVFCLPSLHDPFPSVVREAMFFGLPCVTTNIWAFPEMVVDGETGYMVNPNDPASLASKLIKIIQDPVLAENMGLAGRNRAEQMFTWTTAAQKIHTAVQSLLED